jgi:hypothetical protein
LQDISGTPHVSPQVWTMMPKPATFTSRRTAPSLQLGPFLCLAGTVESHLLRLVYTGLSPPSIGRLFFLLRPS